MQDSKAQQYLDRNGAGGLLEAVHAHWDVREEPCEYGHIGCSLTGERLGPCLDEACGLLETLGIDVNA